VTEHGLATKTERVEYRVWRKVGGHPDRRWKTEQTRADAEQEVAKLRAEGMSVPFGIERVVVTEESDGIEWLDS
jgi:hypothetical protein